LSQDGAHIGELITSRQTEIGFMIFLGFWSMAGADWIANVRAI
jgi:hypothetical protein